MKIDVKVTGIEQLRDVFGFSERRTNAAIATALTRTAKAVAVGWQKQIDQRVDRPTARTQKATRFEGAKANDLTAVVALKEQQPGTPVGTYLRPQERAGDRHIKKFEKALVNSGAMPSGWITVPGKGAILDAHGNVSRAQIVAVLSQLGRDYSPGYKRVIPKSIEKRLETQKKHGRRYIAVRPGTTISPGVYERLRDGSLKMVFAFKSRVSYRARLTLEKDSAGMVQRTFDQELDRAASESLARMQAK